jgi:hypothetical protein
MKNSIASSVSWISISFQASSSQFPSKPTTTFSQNLNFSMLTSTTTMSQMLIFTAFQMPESFSEHLYQKVNQSYDEPFFISSYSAMGALIP